MDRVIDCACEGEAPASVWWRIGAGAFLAMNAMVLGIAVNGSEVTALERRSLEISILWVALAVLVLLVKEFAVATWQSLREARVGIELLFLVGILASLGATVLSIQTGVGGCYADVAAMLLVIYSLGRQIGAYGKSRILKSLADWAPERRMTHLLDGRSVSAARLKAGDEFRIMPGEVVPVDAEILRGEAYFQEATLSGESMAVSRKAGDRLTAGVFAVDASVDCVAVNAGNETSIDKIRELVLSGIGRPGREQGLALAALRWFGPLVVGVSLLTFVMHSRTLGWPDAMFYALSVLVIACPCALGFATPLAVWTAIARLREMGILARSGEAIEKLADIDTVVFDKTGTLTLPDQYEVSWRVVPAWQTKEAELRYLLREAEAGSKHPIAAALSPLWAGQPLQASANLSSVRLIPGSGIEACFDDGRKLFAGVRENSRDLEVRIDTQIVAEIRLSEVCGESVGPSVRLLEAAGLDVMLATGDIAERAAVVPIAKQVSKQSPLDKHAMLSDLQKSGRKVLFVGDGLNDVAAMAWSEVSCTVNTSAALVREMSGLVMLHQDWTKLPEAIAMARQTKRVVRMNILFSLVYNLAGISLAAMGWLHPVAAALMMLASSLTVILYSMHLMDWEAPKT